MFTLHTVQRSSSLEGVSNEEYPGFTSEAGATTFAEELRTDLEHEGGHLYSYHVVNEDKD